MKQKVTFILIGVLLAGSYFLAKSFVPTAPNLTINYECVAFPDIFMQIEPYYTNMAWFTNEYQTNMRVSGVALHTAFIGPCVKLSWNNQDNLILQCTTNFIDWEDLRIRFYGPTGTWFTHPTTDNRFYRLRPSQ